MNDTITEYINGNGNGNGKQKAFELSQPKSSEQIQRESILATMPKLRRNCSQDKRLRKHVGAKWLFGQISDLTFLHYYGGDGFGRVWLSVKDLHRIFGHDEQSLAKWRDKLIETGWIWYQAGWPKACWGIAGVCRQPELFMPHSGYMTTVGKAGKDHPTPSGGSDQNGKTEDFLPINGNHRLDHPSPSGGAPEGTMRTTRVLRVDQPSPSGGNDPKDHADHPEESRTPPEALGSSDPILGVTPPEAVGHIRETPIGNRSQGAIKGVVPPDFDKDFQLWIKSLDGRFASQLEKMRVRFTEQRKRASADGKKLLDRKIAKLDELLDGPQPEWAPPKDYLPKPVAKLPAPAPMPTEEQLVESARCWLNDLGNAFEKLPQSAKKAWLKAGNKIPKEKAAK